MRLCISQEKIPTADFIGREYKNYEYKEKMMMTDYLPVGHVLKFHKRSGEYVITKVLGRGASAIAYLVMYKDGSGRVYERVIKEYCPYDLKIRRHVDGSLACAEEDLAKFEKGKLHFKESGDLQNELRNKTYLKNEIPPLYDILEANHTLYLEVSPFAGQTYDGLEELSLLTRMKICLAVAKLVARYHELGYLCLDLKPENIFVLTNSSNEIVTDLVELIDFDGICGKEKMEGGYALPFTEFWAAPEQMNPYGRNKISEGTDVYAVGELVFWSVFGRHSVADEHRGFSTYPFETAGARFPHVPNRKLVWKKLEKFFRQTLRSSVKNRIASMEEVVELLWQLVVELEKKEYILEFNIRPKPFFIGRDEELDEVGRALQTDDMVFVSGIAGIGKSELVKQYVSLHKDEYDNVLYWVYDGNLEHMVARDGSVTICNFTRIKEESDEQYAKRKLKKLRELLEGQNNLFVIDNMDKLVDELVWQEMWELLKELPGKFVITTRCEERLYKSVQIAPLADMEDLVCLFREYAMFAEEERMDVEDIIQSVNRHTLLVELLAHHARAAHLIPRQLLDKLQKNGICGLSGETVRLLKDGRVEQNSVFSHVERIFHMENMPQEQVLLLAMLALMPAEGVQTAKFISFYLLNDNGREALNCLVRHGWVSIGFEGNEFISLHPTIATVVMEHMKAKEQLLKSLYDMCSCAIKQCSTTTLTESEHVFLTDSIAMSTTDKFVVESRHAAIFIEQYVETFSRYGNIEQKLEQIDFVIEILQKNLHEKKYSAVLEQGYYLKARSLWILGQYEQAISMGEEHLKKAKVAKDEFFMAKWYLMLSGVGWEYIQNSDRLNSGDFFKKYYFKYSFKYFLLWIFHEYRIKKDKRRRNPHFLESSNLLLRLDYDYLECEKNGFRVNLILDLAEWVEHQTGSGFYYSKENKQAVSNLKKAKRLRESSMVKDAKCSSTLNVHMLKDIKKEIDRYRDNDFEIEIDKAKIAFLLGEYQKAEDLLTELVDYHAKQNLKDSFITYRVHHFLAQVVLQKEPVNHVRAVEELERCLEIGKGLLFHDIYLVRLEWGYQSIICGKPKEVGVVADELEMDLATMVLETIKLAPEIRKTYCADAWRNLGFFYYVQGNHRTARDMFEWAEWEYRKAKAPFEMIWFGSARTYMLEAMWYQSNNYEPSDNGWVIAVRMFEAAIEDFENSVGLEHPEAKFCIEELKKIKVQHACEV